MTMGSHTERVFARSMEALDPLFDFASEFVALYDVDDGTAFVLKLALEEAFTNLVKYDAGASPEIPIRLAVEDGRVVVIMKNIGGIPFDITAGGAVDVDAPLERRKIGGLGLHLIRRLVDDLSYEYRDGTGTITITKSLEDKRA